MSVYTGTSFNILAKIPITGNGIWNLEFFHYAVPPFCLSENIKSIHALTLQYPLPDCNNLFMHQTL